MISGKYGRRALLFGIGTTAGALALGSRIWDDATAFPPSSTPSAPTASGSPSPAPDDPFRPVYHYTPASGNLADPNGLILHQGEYHLFHQQDGTWAHAVSADMVHWERLGTALGHDALGLAMSGSCVDDDTNTSGMVPGGGMVAIYTSTEGGEAQSLAYSTDRGRSWRRYDGNPVIPNEGRKDFRDPKVFWHEPTRSWVMVVSLGDRIAVYRSGDLRSWTHASDFGEGKGSHAAVWECPDLFPLDDISTGQTRWVLTTSIGDNSETHGSTAQYFIGDFDGFTFFPEDDRVRFTDAGQDFYAAQTFEKVEGRRIWLGWMGNWAYPYSMPTKGWKNQMSIPRELTLTTRDGVRVLLQQPVRELNALRGRDTDVGGLSATDTTTGLGAGRVVELDLTLDVSKASDAWLGLCRGQVDGTLQEVRVGVLPGEGIFYLDRTAGGLATVPGRDGGTAQFALRREVAYRPVDGKVRLHVHVDNSSVEVFVDDGAPVGSLLVFNDPRAQELVLGAKGTAKVISGAVTPLSLQ